MCHCVSLVDHSGVSFRVNTLFNKQHNGGRDNLMVRLNYKPKGYMFTFWRRQCTHESTCDAVNCSWTRHKSLIILDTSLDAILNVNVTGTVNVKMKKCQVFLWARQYQDEDREEDAFFLLFSCFKLSGFFSEPITLHRSIDGKKGCVCIVGTHRCTSPAE